MKVATLENGCSIYRYFKQNLNIHIPSWRKSHTAALQVANVIPACGTDDCFPILTACLSSAASA